MAGRGTHAWDFGSAADLPVLDFLLLCVQCMKTNSSTHDLCTFLYLNYAAIKSLPKR